MILSENRYPLFRIMLSFRGSPKMPVFTVHAPVDAVRRADSDRFVFVRDGFHFWAFVFGPLWLIWHRLWLALAAYVVIVAAVIGLMVALRTGADARAIVALIAALLTGHEAANAD